MNSILETLTSFPTVIWTVPLGAALVLMVISLFTGGAEAGEGAIEVGVDVDVDVDLDGDVTGPGNHGGFISGLADQLAIGTVPIMVVITAMSGVGFLASLVLELTVADTVRELIGGFLYGSLGFTATFVLALWATTWLVKPLRRYFVVHTQHGQQHLVGSVAIITSSKVTRSFGVAQVPSPDGSAPFQLNVISDVDFPYATGDQVAIVDYDAASNTYTIAPLRKNPSVLGDIVPRLGSQLTPRGESSRTGEHP